MTRYLNLTAAEAAGVLTEIRRPVKGLGVYLDTESDVSMPEVYDGRWIWPDGTTPDCPWQPGDVLTDKKRKAKYRVLSVHVERVGDKWQWVAKVEAEKTYRVYCERLYREDGTVEVQADSDKEAQQIVRDRWLFDANGDDGVKWEGMSEPFEYLVADAEEKVEEL